MLFILGVRIYNHLLATVAYVCENCGQHAAHHGMRRTRKLTLFFLPLLPMSTKYVDQCSFCGRVLRISRERAESATRQPVWGR
jgi:zinc-ribbon family